LIRKTVRDAEPGRWSEGDFATGIQTNVIVRSWMVEVKVRLLNLRVILAERALQGVPRLMRICSVPASLVPKPDTQCLDLPHNTHAK
jgi:hypothetical protein